MSPDGRHLARCRHMFTATLGPRSVIGRRLCPSCQANKNLTMGEPDEVALRITFVEGDQKNVRAFEQVGVAMNPWAAPMPKEGALAICERLGIDPYPYRDDRPDFGTLVFGNNVVPVRGVSVFDTLREQFGIKSFQLFGPPQEGKQSSSLVVTFHRGKTTNMEADTVLQHYLLPRVLNLRIWVNPTGVLDGPPTNILLTPCGGKTPAANLLYSKGLWGLKP